MGVSLGTAVGMPLITLLIVHSDWATSFHALGALNALLGIPLVLLFIRPLSAGTRGSDRDHRTGTRIGSRKTDRFPPIATRAVSASCCPPWSGPCERRASGGSC
ncbi:hypothetical protein [Streptomyces sp. DT203]|uniref:hypothetical protein n=1 Tax=Streptomyces sp. DT203 TaxID=3393424 RepID=UPI003CE8105D